MLRGMKTRVVFVGTHDGLLSWAATVRSATGKSLLASLNDVANPDDDLWVFELPAGEWRRGRPTHLARSTFATHSL